MKAIKETDFYRLFHKFILSTDCHQKDAMSILVELLDSSFQNRMNKEIKILDFGCGAFCLDRKILEDLGLKWTGVDIESKNPSVIFYDGKELPFSDESFHVVFSRQVLEHLIEPDVAISEINRVTKKEGYFIGSVAQLEPFHLMSIYNMTPLALKLLLERHLT